MCQYSHDYILPMHQSQQIVVLQHMCANLSLYRIEFLLEHRDLLDGLEIQVQLILFESIDLVVSHQQHYELHQKFVHLDVFLHRL